MLSAASIAPAPSPNGIASKNSGNADFDSAKPSTARQVSSEENATVIAVPSLLIILAEKKLASTVPKEISIVITLEREMGKLNSPQIAGSDAPNAESGSPSPIKTIKIIIKSRVANFSPL